MTTPRAELVFLKNDAGEEEGLGDAGVETYRDAPYASVARECGQNSADAREKRPVTMRFDLLEIETKEYPAAKKQLEAVRACLDKARARRIEKELDFFLRAETVLTSARFKVLAVSDFNTRGLIGPATPGKPFHSLLKGSGVSSDKSETSGGSFGIGKNAAFAASELQTVFYSTIYRELASGTEHFLAQGKTILVSHTGADRTEHEAKGYWGLPSFMPISDPMDTPQWMRRTEVGTSVFVIGFREEDHWQERIAASLLQNFFCAIHRGDIQFEIDDGRISINGDSISSHFLNPGIIEGAELSNQREDFDFARNLFDCLTSADATAETLEIEGLGKVSLRILLRDGLPKRVCIVRNGMAITDNLAHFGHKLTRFPMYKEFVALVEPMDTQGSVLLKRLENPKHDSLSADRLPDTRKRLEATRAMKALATQIRSAIKQLALPKPEDVTNLDELAKFFADSDQSDKPPDPSGDDNLETVKISTAAKRAKRPSASDPNLKGPLGGRGNVGGGRGRAGGRGSGSGRGSGGSGQSGGSREIVVLDARNTVPTDGDWNRTVYFTPEESGQCRITISAAGIEDAQPIDVTASDAGNVLNGKVRIELREKERSRLNVRFSRPYDGPIEIGVVADNRDEQP